MASVQYQLFCKCINTVTKKAITNKEKRTWVSDFNQDAYFDIDNEEKYVLETIAFNIKSTAQEEADMQNKIIEGSKVIARVNPRTTAKAQSDIKIAFDLNKVHLFDKETEKTIIN